MGIYYASIVYNYLYLMFLGHFEDRVWLIFQKDLSCFFLYNLIVIVEARLKSLYLFFDYLYKSLIFPRANKTHFIINFIIRKRFSN